MTTINGDPHLYASMDSTPTCDAIDSGAPDGHDKMARPAAENSNLKCSNWWVLLAVVVFVLQFVLVVSVCVGVVGDIGVAYLDGCGGVAIVVCLVDDAGGVGGIGGDGGGGVVVDGSGRGWWCEGFVVVLGVGGGSSGLVGLWLLLPGVFGRGSRCFSIN